MIGQKTALTCPICGGRVNITIDVSVDHVTSKGAVCSNERFAHIGFTLYRFKDALEEAAQPRESELILN